MWQPMKLSAPKTSTLDYTRRWPVDGPQSIQNVLPAFALLLDGYVMKAASICRETNWKLLAPCHPCVLKIFDFDEAPFYDSPEEKSYLPNALQNALRCATASCSGHVPAVNMAKNTSNILVRSDIRAARQELLEDCCTEIWQTFFESDSYLDWKAGRSQGKLCIYAAPQCGKVSVVFRAVFKKSNEDITTRRRWLLPWLKPCSRME